jgi:RNA polymerase sigma-70 factor (ECF subfamily)
MVDGMLREAFLRALPDPRRQEAEQHPALDAVLSQWTADAASAWGPVVVPTDRFLAHVAANLRTDCSVVDAMAEVRPTDLYIACACAQGDSAAIRRFEERYFRELDILWPSFRECVGPDDARQLLRQKLFARSDTAEPKIARFSGRGDLRGWVRVVAARMLADLADKNRPERLVDDAFFDKLSTGVDMELDRFKAQYGAAFKEAFRLAVETLTPRERSLLRHAYVRDASVVEIGAVYGVHGATAARWVANARQRLVHGLRKALSARLKITNAELESILRILESTVHVTLERYFREAEEAH